MLRIIECSTVTLLAQPYYGIGTRSKNKIKSNSLFN